MNFSIFVVCLMAIGMAAPIHAFFFDHLFGFDASVGLEYESKCGGFLSMLGLCQPREEKSEPGVIIEQDQPEDDRRKILIQVVNELGVEYVRALQAYMEMTASGQYSYGSRKCDLQCQSLNSVYAAIKEIKDIERC